MIAEDADVSTVDELLGVLEGTSSGTARIVDMPPLELEEVRRSLAELRAEAPELPADDDLAAVYQALRRQAARERHSVLEVSSGVGLAFLLSAKNVSRRHLIVPYQEDWQPVRNEGFGAYALRVGRPYAGAVGGHFHPERETYTERFLSRNTPGTDAEFCDELDENGGFGWKMDERLQRCSHALVGHEGVWIFDPVAWEPALERIAELGKVAGVVQLLDRHQRDCADVAARFGVPHFAVPVRGIPASGLEIAVIANSRFWREVAVWMPSRQALVCADALGTIRYFRAGDEPVGVHPFLRLKPPKALARFEPQHILCGHGAGVHGPDAPAALENALRTSRRRLPKALAGAFRRG